MSKDITFAIKDIQNFLKDLEVKTSSFASVLVSIDGLPITSAAHNYVNELEASALAASILALGEQTTSTFEHDRLQRVLIEGEKGTTVLTGVNEEFILITIAPPEAKLGLLFIEISNVIEKINQRLESP